MRFDKREWRSNTVKCKIVGFFLHCAVLFALQAKHTLTLIMSRRLFYVSISFCFLVISSVCVRICYVCVVMMEFVRLKLDLGVVGVNIVIRFVTQGVKLKCCVPGSKMTDISVASFFD